VTDGPLSSPSGSNGAATAVARQSEPVPEDRSEERIAELRRRYLEGTYKVDATQLSAKIIDKHLEK
jgi:anti-sigma28 factor (negative regulator of flagellin synthesis)